MPKTAARSPARVHVRIVIGVALAAVLWVWLGCNNLPSGIWAKLYYDYPLPCFAEPFHMQSGNPNHPNSYSAEVRRNCGIGDNAQYGIKVYSSETYQTDTSDLCLNLETGVLRVDTSVSGWEQHYTIAPPRGGGDYFDYLDRLAAMKETLNTVATGCLLVQFGFNYPPRPQLWLASHYVARVTRQLERATTIDAVAARVTSGMPIVRLGTPVELEIRHKASDEREILIQFRDEGRVHAQTSARVEAGAGTAIMRLPLPRSVPDPDATRICVGIVPVGGDWSRRFGERTLKVEVRRGDS